MSRNHGVGVGFEWLCGAGHSGIRSPATVSTVAVDAMPSPPRGEVVATTRTDVASSSPPTVSTPVALTCVCVDCAFATDQMRPVRESIRGLLSVTVAVA